MSGGITSAQILNGGSGYENGKRITGVLDYGKWAWGKWNKHEAWTTLVLPFSSNAAANDEHGYVETGELIFLGIKDFQKETVLGLRRQ